MKAVICTKYGPPDVLQLQEVPKPVPKDNEVLIKVHAASVTSTLHDHNRHSDVYSTSAVEQVGIHCEIYSHTIIGDSW